jgi:galactosamine-6-phosphate isomerase
MELKIFEDNQSLSAYVARQIVATVEHKPNALLCLATGDSPLLSYEMAAADARARSVDFTGAYFIALDEWMGIPPEDTGSCTFFLRKHILEKLSLQKECTPL